MANKKTASIFCWLRLHLIYALVFIVMLYGVGLLFFGTKQGIYLCSFTWLYDYFSITPSGNAYDISFYASASQDFWFFITIGIAVAWLTSSDKRDAKDDNLTTKVNHFFPEVDPASGHMRFLEKVINKNSCIATDITSTLSIITLDNDFYELLVHTSTSLKNIHHNHSIDENNGSFSLFPDDSVVNSKIPWGRVNSFIFEADGSDEKSIACAEDLNGEKFEVDYNIKLGAGNVGKIVANYSMWNDLKQPFEITPTMFALNYLLKFENKTAEKLSIEVHCRKNLVCKYDLDVNESTTGALSIKDVISDVDIIVVNVKKL